ncbi:MAG: hypothetical protein JNL61_07435 [Rhizobiaceae bacterium]|nr:hypothetical protein [Rhizobiaceae bacterium]
MAPGMDDRLIRLQGSMLAFEQVFGRVMAALCDGATIDRRMFNEEIVDAIAAQLRQGRAETFDAETRRTYDAALRLLEDLRAGKAAVAVPFRMIRGGKTD